jgi:Rrf2 family protein
MASQRGRPPGSGVVWPSAKTVYALQACALLGVAYPGHLLKLDEIVAQTRAPRHFLSRILGELRDAEIVNSRRGYYGGYVLQRDPHDISVAEIARAVDGYELFAPIPRHRSASRLAFVEDLRSHLRDLASSSLEATSIAQLAVETEAPSTAG